MVKHGISRRQLFKLGAGFAASALVAPFLHQDAYADGECPPPNPDHPNWYNIDPIVFQLDRTYIPGTSDVNKQYLDMCVYPNNSDELNIAEYHFGGEGVMVTYVPEGSLLNISRLVRFLQIPFPELTENSFLYTFAPDAMKIPGNPDLSLSSENPDIYIPGGSPLLLKYKDNAIDFPIGDGFTQKPINDERNRIVLYGFIEYLRDSLATPEYAGISKEFTYQNRITPMNFEPNGAGFSWGLSLIMLFAACGIGFMRLSEIRNQQIAIAKANEALNNAKKESSDADKKPLPDKKASGAKPPQLGK